ncbi:MAG: type II toxin-antitoxin system HicA family toxin [Candidatus Thermoplasmatota archaeon]
MPRLPVVSGREAIKALSRLGFRAVRQRGSHVVMTGHGRTVSVPLHAELDRGTLRAILRQANVSVEQFIEAR